MMGYGWGMGFGGWMFMGLFWVVLIGLGAWLVVALLPRVRSGGSETPEEILDRRYARGELDTEEYRRAPAALPAPRPRGQGPPRGPTPHHGLRGGRARGV